MIGPRSSVALLGLAAACSTAAPGPGPAAEKSAQPSTPARIQVRRHPPLRITPPCDPSKLQKEELRVQSEPGISIFVTHVPAPAPKRGAVVLTHGAGSPGSALWDLPGDVSLLRNLACAGFDAYALDVRGFGGSTLPAALSQPAQGRAPVVRARDVQPDLQTVVRLAQARSQVRRVHLFGWSWGCVVAGMFASEHPEAIDRLVLFAPVYDRRWPTRHIQDVAWRTEERAVFFKYFDPARESREVLEAHVNALFRFAGDGPLRLPNGPYRDLYGEDAPVWNPRTVTADTLVVRGERDRASLDEPARRLVAHLERARARHYVVLPGAGHFAFRTHRYRDLQRVVRGFLETGEAAAP